MNKTDLKIYKQQGKTWSNPADSLRDTFSKKEIDFFLLGVDIFPVIHVNSQEKIYVSLEDIK